MLLITIIIDWNTKIFEERRTEISHERPQELPKCRKWQRAGTNFEGCGGDEGIPAERRQQNQDGVDECCSVGNKFLTGRQT